MLSLSDNNQTDIIEAFNSTSRYLDDLLKIDNPYFVWGAVLVFIPYLWISIIHLWISIIYSWIS